MSKRSIGGIAGLLGLVVLVALVVLALPATRQRLFPRQDYVWLDMQNRKSWRVGMDPSFPPFESLDANNQPTGFDVDIAGHMAVGWGLRLEIVAIGFDSLLDALQAGKIDSVVSAFPYDPRMTKDVAFSSPYFEAGIRLAVPANSPIRTVADLSNRKVAVEWGSMGDMVGRRLQRDDASIQLAQYPTPQEALDALTGDPQVDAALVDNVTLRAAQAQGKTIVAVGPALESNPYVIVAPRMATDLQAQIEQMLHTMQGQGLLSDLEKKWFAKAQ